jgi:beta-lactamase regulating signal transducer with metallopeptidase domain
MQPIYAYITKLAICLALGYMFYLLLLRRMTWYAWNRYYLLFLPLAALALPALPLALPSSLPALNAAFFVTGSQPAAAGIAASAGAATQGPELNLPVILLVLLCAGAVFFLLRLLFRVYFLYRTRRMARLVNAGDVKLYHLPGCTAPFSFYNAIYLDTTRYDASELESILQHELVHVSQKHTLDVLVAECICIVQWFNPAAWMLKHAIKQNLEFIADDQVLRKGINRKGYQYLLLKVSGAIPHSLATNLLFPSLKERISMMNKDRSGKKQLLKYLCIIPLACLLVFAFGTRTGSSHTDKDEFSLSSVSFYISDEQAARIIKQDQANSLLKEGGAISLGLISEEKARLKALLERNGYDTSGGRTISFVMDTSLTSKSFTVKVVVDAMVKQHKNINLDNSMMDIRQAYRSAVSNRQEEPYKITAALQPPGATARDNTAVRTPGRSQ